MRRLTKTEIKLKLEFHGKWLKNEEGGEEADLQGADLQGANLQRADLRRANLQGANLQGADLRGADLQGANLRRADLQGANLQGANLRGADLRGADLRRADLRGADLRGADLDFSSWPLWCGSKNVKIDLRLAMQLAAHFCAVECEDPEYQTARKAIFKFALKSHIAEYLK